MKVKYTAISGSNQRLEGVLDSESIDIAREELHKMNLSIIAINEISEEEASKHVDVNHKVSTETTSETKIATYYFSAQDVQQKEINGTIDAADPISAFKRLITEYNFTVTDLYPSDADPINTSFKGKFKEWRKTLEEEGVDLSIKSTSVKGELEDSDGLNKEIITEIDKFIINTKKILSEHKDQYTDAFLREIEKKLDELERIRASNNLKHITKVCNNLYELIAHPDINSAKTNNDQDQSSKEYDSIVTDLKGSGFVSSKLDFLQAHKNKKKSMRFNKIQGIFAKIVSKLNKKQGDALAKKLAGKKRNFHLKWISDITKSLNKKSNETNITFKEVVIKFFEWVKASNTILRRARKQELITTYNNWRIDKAKKQVKKPNKETCYIAEHKNESTENRFTILFAELDSFIGWLLFFYITYFFIGSFSLEKNIGLPQDLIIKTFSSHLLINIVIFLIIAHLIFTIKSRLFKGHALSGIFLFFLGFGLYTILVVNF